MTPFLPRPLSLVLASTGLVAAVACAPDADPNRLRVSGHVEATEVRLAPELGGRVLTIEVKEGDRVEVGARILTLDAADLVLGIARARADQSAAEAQLRLVRASARSEDVQQAVAQMESVRADVPAARAEVDAATADLQRFELLLARKSGSQKQRDDAATRRDVAQARLDAAEKRVVAAAAIVARVKVGARKEEVDVALSRIATAAAAIASLEEQLKDATLVAPVSGIVTDRLTEVGEVIAPRTPAVVITDLDHAWADVYVPGPVVPRITLGQAATLFTDAGGSGLPGQVTYISPKAEFTPRNVQTAEERARLVYRIRITVDNAAGILKQGMTVDAELALPPAPAQP